MHIYIYIQSQKAIKIQIKNEMDTLDKILDKVQTDLLKG